MTRRWIVTGPTRSGWYLVVDTALDVVDDVHRSRARAQDHADELECEAAAATHWPITPDGLEIP